MLHFETKMLLPSKSGFTLIELLVVVVILAIASAVAIPMFSSGSDLKVRAVSDMIMADLEYAKSMAISRGTFYSVIFDTANETYSVVDGVDNVISHPTKVGDDFIVNLKADSRVDQVDIFSVDFGSTATVKFDYLGTPYNGSGTTLSAEGVITLKASTFTRTVNVEPVTGYISIQ